MRQGPDYAMPIVRDDWGVAVPLEIWEDFATAEAVNWHDNGDGTYTLSAIKSQPVPSFT